MSWKDIQAFADALMSPPGHVCVLTDFAKAVIIAETAAATLTSDHERGTFDHCTVCGLVYPCPSAKRALSWLMLAAEDMDRHAQKFKIGDRVKIVKILDDIISQELLGWEGVVEEVEENGPQITYYVDDMYLDERMLERAA